MGGMKTRQVLKLRMTAFFSAGAILAFDIPLFLKFSLGSKWINLWIATGAAVCIGFGFRYFILLGAYDRDNRVP